VLERQLTDVRALLSCERLSGGANQETYRIVVEGADGARPLCLRRAAGGATAAERQPGQPGLPTEAALFQAARKAGVPEPEVYYVLQPHDGLGEGFVMEWLDGETLGARIARGDTFAAIRPQLARQCGQLLARIHRIDAEQAGVADTLEVRTPEEVIRLAWERYQSYGTPQPMIDYTARWLLEHLPAASRPTLVHGDFRNGNLMVDPHRGVVAVLDWEGAHLGDPMRDLGWLCTNSWRFGVSELPVGGFGELAELLDGYAEEHGSAPDPDHVKFWIVFGSFSWAIGCLTMAEHYRTGPDATVERPAIGRRSSECQVDCANLLIPGPVSIPDPDPAPDALDMPRSDELLTSVRDFLRGDVMASTEGRIHFLARVAANSLDILLREAELGSAYRRREAELLAAVTGQSGDLATQRRALAESLRDGSTPLDAPGLDEYLRYACVTQVLIDQPRYSGARTALG
jgi:aminoglycoside phosphotransferase (APT) family kinase protein